MSVDEIDFLEVCSLDAEEVVELDGVDGDALNADFAETPILVGSEGLVGGRGRWSAVEAYLAIGVDLFEQLDRRRACGSRW